MRGRQVECILINIQPLPNATTCRSIIGNNPLKGNILVSHLQTSYVTIQSKTKN